jgi:catechol 2,3-dioxygenase-like lactoylglutathione lyase family enzyme
MRILGIDWIGIRTNNIDELLRLFQTAMGLELVHKEDENQFVVLSTKGGDKVELFGSSSKYNTHFVTATPVVGFLVDNIEQAREELRSKGIELIGDINRSKGGSAWQHFRGPDGNLYELNYDPARVKTSEVAS